MVKKKKQIRPVKKKGRKKKNNNKHRLSAFFSSFEKMVIWAIIIVVVFIGLLFVFEKVYQPADSQPTSTEQIDRPASVEPESLRERPVTTHSRYYPADCELPRLKVKQMEQVIRHEGYTVSYNSDYKIANWVAWELTAVEAISKKTERKNDFVPDPQAKGATAMREDYSKSGFDRGHLAPAGDMKWSAKAMRESFYFSNICPQVPALNQGIWKDLEEQCRRWAVDHDTILIATGPVIEEGLRRLGKNRVGIPKRFYKVICTLSDNKYYGIAFLLENKDYKRTLLQDVAIPIDSVEKVTGIDFFPAVPDEWENRMEASVDKTFWSF